MLLPLAHRVSNRVLVTLLALFTAFHEVEAQNLPANDAFAQAAVIEGEDVLLEAFNDLASMEPDEPAHGGIPASRSLWWAYHSPAYANVFVDAASSAFDAVVAVYVGDTLAGLTAAPGRYAGTTGNPKAAFSFVAEPGKTYRVVVDVLAGTGGRVGLHLGAAAFEPVPAEIVAQPVGARIALGGSATLRVGAKGAPAVSFQWWRDDQPVARGTNAALEFKATQLAEAGNYTVVVSNLLGWVRSSVAVLQVTLNPLITVQPVMRSANPREQATFSVTAIGSSISSYQWFKDGVPIPNATKATLTVDNVQAADEGLYRVRVANFYGTDTSVEVPLSLNRPATAEELKPEIVTLWGMPPAEEGTWVTFEAKVVGAKPQAFQWYRDGVPVPRATNQNFTWQAALDLAGTYSLTVSTAHGSVTGSLSPTVVTPMVRPPNDNFADRLPLHLDPSVSGSNGRATREPAEPLTGPVNAGKSVWWTYQVPADGMVTVATTGTGFYPVVSVYSGNTLAGLTLVTRGASTSSYGATTVTFHGYAGDTFQVSVEDYHGNGGTIRLSPSLVPDPPKGMPPEITKQPEAAVTINAGAALTLQVEATGAYPLNYEWRQGDRLIADAPGPVLTITNAQPVDSGSYTVTVANANGQAASSPATVVVNGVVAQFAAGLPVISVTAGYPVSLTPRVTGHTPFQYQWTLDGRPLPGATQRTLQWVPARPSGPTSIGLTVVNPVGSSSPTPALVTVVPAGVRYRWTTLAGVPNQAGRVDGLGSSARFSSPSGITLNAEGTLYVADAGSGSVRRVTSEGEVTTLVGADEAAVRFIFPVDVAFDRDGRLLVLNQGLSVYRLFGDGLVGSLAGGEWGMAVAADGALWRTVSSGRIQRVAVDGSVTLMTSALQTAVDVTFDAAGNAYIAEASGPTIRRLAVDGQLTILAGVSGKFGSLDGPAATALFQHPNSVSFDGAGNLFVADEFANTIRRISPDGTVTTVGGAFLKYGNADGVGSDARFSNPRRVVATHDGTLYVVDTAAHTVRKGEPIAPAPPALQARMVEGAVQVSWTPNDALVWLEGADRPNAEAGAWVPLDPLSDRTNPQHTLTETDAGEAGFFRLRAE